MNTTYLAELECPRTELLFSPKEGYTTAQAVAEASRCLFCHDAPCMNACPTHIDIPLFIRQIMTGNPKGSARTILSSNIMGLSCAQVCPVEVLCEGACVMHKSGKEPIHIGKLQQYAVNWAYSNNISFFTKGKPTGKKVAVIGAGPAGLSCAAELVQLGHDVVVYEARKLPGGLDTFGVAPYKLFSEEALKEIEFIQKIGVEIQTGITVGKDIDFSDLEKKFDLIFIGVGLGKDAPLNIPGENLPGCIGAIAFIEALKTKNIFNPKEIKSAVVLGGGNTALDVVRELKKLGVPKVTLAYRRSEKEMSGYKHEKDAAAKEGVEFLFHTAPVAVLGNGKVAGLRCVKMQASSGLHEFPKPIPNSEFEILCDLVVKATGQEKLSELFSSVQNLKVEKGLIQVNPKTFQTNHPKYFAAGDCVSGGEEVVNAVADGKKAAHAMQILLMGKNKEASHGGFKH
jgi:dihydropyrimidine dehydrogenase (NAD+) subunit PreT